MSTMPNEEARDMTECRFGSHKPAATLSGRPAVIRVICVKCGDTINNTTKEDAP